MSNHTDPGLVEIWPEFVDWDKRKTGDSGFLESKLRSFGCVKVYDLCLGGGFDSIELINAGFDVTSNEIDQAFVDLALRNAQARNTRLNLTSHDWRQLPGDPHFDAAIMLGNSFIYIDKDKDRKDILRNIYRLLNPGGIFMIDHRNFEYILKDSENIIQGDYRYSKKYVYCGTRVVARPIEIRPDDVLFEYHDLSTGKRYYLHHYPIKEDELKGLLIDAGFSEIQTFYDYKDKKPNHHDFVQHIAKKQRVDRFESG